MAFLNQRFPDHIARGAEGGHGFWDVGIVTVASGRESANLNWQLGKGRWNISQGLKEDADFEEIEAFFYMARGKFHHWRFRDWTDYELARENSRLVQITSTTFQVSKVYGDDPEFEYVRPLTRLVGDVSVWKDDVLQASGFTADPDTGIVTFDSPPGEVVLEAECEFDVPCRFDVEGRNAQLVHRNSQGKRVIAWEDISIVEVRE